MKEEKKKRKKRDVSQNECKNIFKKIKGTKMVHYFAVSR